jgi:hypothetical protein
MTPCLTELLSNNLPPQVFFNPLVFLFLATIAYGFPVLLLREFACRSRLGLPGLFCLGLVYGIINEGILAKTFYLAQGVPVNTFDHYGYVAGICGPWAVTISVWHALHAVLYPIFLTYYFFPAHRDQPWLTRTSVIWLAVPAIVMSTLVFFTRSQDRAPGRLPHFILMLACMGLLAWLATKAPRSSQLTPGTSFRLKPIAWGSAGFLALLLVPVLLSKAKVAPVIFYGYFAVAFALMACWLTQRPTIPIITGLLFAIGDELVTVLWALPGARGRGGIPQLTADALLLVAFVLLLARLRRDSRRSHDAGVAGPAPGST